MRQPKRTAVLVVFLAVGCGQNGGGQDAGVEPPDGGRVTSHDAGHDDAGHDDAGRVAQDAGELVQDAGADGGPADAGADADAGTGADAGALADAGSNDGGWAADGGAGTDGGLDGGTTWDAGTDGGTTGDAGTPWTALESSRRTWIVGHVTDLQGAAIVGAVVEVLNARTRYAPTTTDSSGDFRLAVNGGELVTVEIRANGYLVSQRQTSTGWRVGGDVGVVMLVTADAKATTVRLDGNAGSRFTHQSSPVTDSDGTRGATVVFAGDTIVKVRTPEGLETPLVGPLTVRATEFPKPKAMPASLPPNSGFTYCTELSIDGVDPHSTVTFSKPVVVWVNNFLGFTPGEKVPLGSYNRSEARWVPADDGVVVELIDALGDGVVTGVDINNDGIPDDLNGDGHTNDEVAGLSGLPGATPGATFWRVQVDHFTPWDANWPYDFPADAVAPQTKPPTVPRKNNCESKVSPGSSFTCESGILEQDFKLPGTGLSLHYSSELVAGHAVALGISVTPATVPTSLLGVEVSVQVGDRSFRYVVPPSANQVVNLAWDGKDSKGALFSGPQVARVHIDYTYALNYTRPSGGTNARSFAAAGSSVVIKSRSTPAATLSRDFEIVLDQHPERAQTIAARTLGAAGWTLSGVQDLDPITGTLYRGGGGLQAKGQLVPRKVRPQPYARQSTVEPISWSVPRVIGPDGSGYTLAAFPNEYFYHQFPMWTILRDKPDGAVELAFGGGCTNFGGTCPQGTPPDFPTVPTPYSPESFHDLWAFNVGLDGTLIYLSWYSQPMGPGGVKVRQVGLDGLLTTVAQFAPCGPANYSSTVAGSQALAKGPDGTVHLACAEGFFEARADNSVSPSPVPSTGVPAAVTTARDGTIFRVEDSGKLLRVIRPDRTTAVTPPFPGGIDVIAPDTSGHVYFTVNPGSVLAPGLYLWDGTTVIVPVPVDARLSLRTYLPGLGVVLADNTYLWKLGFVDELGVDGLIADERGGLAYRFTPEGYHVQTLDLATRVPVLNLERSATGALTALTDRFGAKTVIERDLSGTPTAIIGPDGLRSTLKIIGGQLVGLSFDDGSAYSFAYTPDGLMTAKTEPTAALFKYDFGGHGLLTTVTDAVGGITKLDLFNQGNALVSSVTDPMGRVTTRTKSDDALGGVSRKVVDPASLVTNVQEPPLGGPQQSTSPDGTVVSVTWGWNAFNGVPLVSASTTRLPSSLTQTVSQDATWTDTNHDGIPETILEGVTVNGRHASRLQDVDAGTTTATSPAGRKSTFTYDRTTLLVSSSTSPNGSSVAWTYDPRGRPATMTESASGELSRVRSFTYGANGLVRTLTDPLMHTSTREYDAVGRVSRVVSPGGATTGYQRDALGRPTTIVTPLGASYVLGYTGVGLPAKLDSPNLDGGVDTTTWTYDAAKTLKKAALADGRSVSREVDSAGRVNKVTTDFGVLSLSYDSTTGVLASAVREGETLSVQTDGHVPTRLTWSGPVSGTVSFQLDSDFRVAGVTAGGATAARTYDADGLLTQSGLCALTLDPKSGAPLTLKVGNGTTSFGYDGFGALKSHTTTVGSTTLFSALSTRDGRGRLSTTQEQVMGVTHSFAYGYDLDGRLTTVTRDGSAWANYAYDADGNRTSSTVAGSTASATFDARDRILTQGAATYTVGPAGDLKQRVSGALTTSYSHEATGMLRGVVLSDGRHVDYLVDGAGRRVGKKVAGTLVQGFLYQNELQPAVELDGTGALVSRFVYASSVGPPVYMLKGGKTYLFVTDALGSVRLVVDATSGAVAQQLTYDPFGRVLSDTSPGFQPFGFAGGLFDRDTGLVHFGARDYDAETGRWTTPDPLGFGGGSTNFYEYAEGDPVNHVDPSGRSPALAVIGVMTAYVGYLAYHAFSAQHLAEDQTSMLPGGHNGEGDAMRHCIWSCEMTRTMGSANANAAGLLHEAQGDVQARQPLEEERMDLHNNACGRQLGLSPDGDCRQKCQQAYGAGDLVTLPENSSQESRMDRLFPQSPDVNTMTDPGFLPWR